MEHEAARVARDGRGNCLCQYDGGSLAIGGPDHHCAGSRASIHCVLPGWQRLVAHDEIKGNGSLEKRRVLREDGCGRQHSNYESTEQIRFHLGPPFRSSFLEASALPERFLIQRFSPGFSPASTPLGANRPEKLERHQKKLWL